MNIKLITHTGAELSIEECNKLDIKLVYDIVTIQDKAYKNILDISPEKFYELLKNSKALPTTSHGSLGDFYDCFKRELTDDSIILFLSITSLMSGTYEMALTVKNILEKEGFANRIYVYDTLECSIGMGKLVRKAKELIDLNLNIENIISKLDDYRKRIRVSFILNSLKYASLGGRVGKIKALAADKLKIKPILSFDDGYVHDIFITKGTEEALTKILETFKENGDLNEEVIVFHSDNLEKANELKNCLLKIDKNLRIRIEQIGPVIGVYTGPGALGISYLNK